MKTPQSARENKKKKKRKKRRRKKPPPRRGYGGCGVKMGGGFIVYNDWEMFAFEDLSEK